MRFFNKERIFNKEQKNIYSPLKMTRELQKLGEKRDRAGVAAAYAGVLLMVCCLGLLYRLKPIFLGIAALYWLISVPQLIMTWKRGAFEEKRFADVNAYMTQMGQSFQKSGSIPKALRETMDTFLPGRMQEHIDQALEHMNTHMKEDVRRAEQEALAILEGGYECEKLRRFHSFLITAEMRGGDCGREFSLLERDRDIWEKAVGKYHAQMKFTRNGVTAQYVFLMLICVYLLSKFPDYISIIDTGAVQLVNMLQIICLGMVFKHVDRRTARSLLQREKKMTAQKAEKLLEDLEHYDGKKEFIRDLPFVVLCVGIAAVMFVIGRNTVTAVLGILLVVGMAERHRLRYEIRQSRVRSEIAARFPEWMFDMLLLLQKESVPAAVLKSVRNAPPIMQKELGRISGMLAGDPGSADAFLSFFAGFGIPGVENSMRRLYALNVGCGGRKELDLVIDSVMEMLAEQERRALKNKGDMTALYAYLPSVPVAVSLMVYCVILLMKVIQNIMSLV